jgi:hypothetical protein
MYVYLDQSSLLVKLVLHFTPFGDLNNLYETELRLLYMTLARLKVCVVLLNQDRMR